MKFQFSIIVYDFDIGTSFNVYDMNVVRTFTQCGGLKYFLYDIDIGSNESF